MVQGNRIGVERRGGVFDLPLKKQKFGETRIGQKEGHRKKKGVSQFRGQ